MYCVVSVCLSVCLSVNSRISKNDTSKLHEISCTRYLWLWRQCSVRTSGFVDDVMVSRNGAKTDIAAIGEFFIVTRRWRRGEVCYRRWPSLTLLFMAALCNRAGYYIFALWFLSIFFFSSPNLSGRRVDVYHTSTHGVALVRI